MGSLEPKLAGHCVSPSLPPFVLHLSLVLFPRSTPAGVRKVMAITLGLRQCVSLLASSLTRKSGEQEPDPVSLSVPAGPWTGMVSDPGIVGVGMGFSVTPN